MYSHTCEKCNRSFKLKSDLKRHYNRKYPCNFDKNLLIIKEEPKNFIVESIDNNSKCYYCDKNFSRIDNLERHITTTCKAKKTIDEQNKHKNEMIELLMKKMNNERDNEIKKILEDYENQINKLKNTILSLQQKINKSANNSFNNNVNSNNINSNNNIIIQFGNEVPYEKLTNKEIANIVFHI